MVDEVLHPGEVGVARGRHTVGPALVVLEQLAAPVAVVEGRVGEHVVGLEVGVPIVVEGIAVADLRVDAADCNLKQNKTTKKKKKNKTKKGDVAELAGVGLDEFLALHE